MFDNNLGVWATVWSEGSMTVGMVVAICLVGAGIVLLGLGLREASSSALVSLGVLSAFIGLAVSGMILTSTPEVKENRLEDGLSSKIEEKYEFNVSALYDSKTENGYRKSLNPENGIVYGFVEGRVLLENGEWYDSTYKFGYKDKDGGEMTLHVMDENSSIAPKDFLK